MSLMSVLFWRCEEAKWKPHVELFLALMTAFKKELRTSSWHTSSTRGTFQHAPVFEVYVTIPYAMCTQSDSLLIV